MQITMNNHSDRTYEALFDDLIREVFGFSFAPWFEHNLWDGRYESYSVIQNGRMLAGICIYKTDMLVNGTAVRAHQFGGVATRKSERGKGLSRLLMEHILSKYPDTPAFLAANPSVLDFYPRFGFRGIRTYRPEIAAEIQSDPDKAVRLAPDDERVTKALRQRGAYSNTLDSQNTSPVQMFHLLLDYPDSICRLPGCDVIAVAEQQGDRLYIADIIASEPVAFEAVRRELPFAGIRRVEFGFCPDWLGVSPEWLPSGTDQYFIRGCWNLPEKFRFPATSET